jgi:hypothetical protein
MENIFKGWNRIALAIAIVAVIVVVCAVALNHSPNMGATSAYLHDEETVADNQFTGGAIDLVVCNNNLVFNDVKPAYSGRGGESKQGAIIGIQSISNNGTNPGMLTVAIRNVRNTEGTTWEPETNIVEPGDLGDVLVIEKIVFGTTLPSGPSYLLNGDLGTVNIGKTVNDLADDLAISTGITVPPNNTATYYAEVYWRVINQNNYILDNAAMGDVCKFDLSFGLDQVTPVTVTW